VSAYSPINPADRTNERLVRMPELMQRTSLSRSTIYRRMARGEFPQSIAIGANSAAWYASDVDRWLEAPMDWRLDWRTSEAA
jgi:prophage regulatory protein